MNDLSMSERTAGIMAEAERVEICASADTSRRPRAGSGKPPGEDLAAHQFPAKGETTVEEAGPQAVAALQRRQQDDREREQKIYRGRTVGMLRRYLRYSIEAGRLPSLLGSEFFRAKVTAYTVVTFEDRVIFVHDMETCLDRLDDFSRQLIARHILQEHDLEATGRLLGCNERTVRTYVPIVLDVFCEILLEVGLLERVVSIRENCCQGGLEDQIAASDCADGKYKV
ncbi:MAG: hypothetical protein ACLPHP_15855 [Candidatus Sulfotelmatobacter sp.]